MLHHCVCSSVRSHGQPGDIPRGSLFGSELFLFRESSRARADPLMTNPSSVGTSVGELPARLSPVRSASGITTESLQAHNQLGSIGRSSEFNAQTRFFPFLFNKHATGRDSQEVKPDVSAESSPNRSDLARPASPRPASLD